MSILLLDALVPEATAWLQERHAVAYRPELLDNRADLVKAARHVTGIVFPRHTPVTRAMLDDLPALKALGRLHVGTDNTDIEACQDRGIRVIHSTSANVRSNAEYLLAALLLLYRRGVVSAFLGNAYPTAKLGRELSGSTVGILGLAPSAHALAGMLNALGVNLIGYDPAVHHTSSVWAELGIQPVTLPELMASSDAISVQILYGTRFKGLVGERVLTHCKPGQLWVSMSRSDLFDAAALAAALQDGRIEACVIDGVERAFIAAGSPLHGLPNLAVTPRLGSHTREARLRSSWYVAHRLHAALSPTAATGTLIGIEGLPELTQPMALTASPSQAP